MSIEQLEFVAGDRPLGRATLRDGDLTYDADVIADIMAPTVAMVGPVRAMRRFDGWSNGYVSAARPANPQMRDRLLRMATRR